MLDATGSAAAEVFEKDTPYEGVIGAIAGPSPQKSIEDAAVAATTGFMTPFAMVSEASMFWRKARGLAVRWGQDAARCRSMPELIELNARFGERAMALGYSGMWRVMERSAMLARQSVAPRSYAMRNAEDEHRSQR